MHSTQLFHINLCSLGYLSELSLCSTQCVVVYRTICTLGNKNTNKVSKWKEIIQHLNCRLTREWNDFFLENNTVFHFLLFRVRTSTINFCYQKTLLFWKKQCALWLLIHMYAFMGKAVTFVYDNQLKVKSP